MGAILTNKSRFFNVENFISAVKSGDKMLYIFLAKDDKWEPNTDFPNGEIDDITDDEEFVTPDPLNTVARERIDSEDIICMKRVLYQDITTITKYLPWEYDTVYDMYDDSDDLFEDGGKNYFVVNTTSTYTNADKHVYKCIVQGPGPSTEQPTSIDPVGTIKSSSDGYEWKYMYSLEGNQSGAWNWSSDILNVADENAIDWMPVKNIQKRSENPSLWEVMKNTVDGAIHHIVVNSGPEIEDGEVTLYDKDGILWSGFEATCTNNKITVTNPGSGINKISMVKIGITDVTNRVRPIYAPPGGHGSNPVKELMGCYVYIQSSIPEDITWNTGEYRKIGLIYDPLRVKKTDGSNNKLSTVSDSDELILGEKINKEAPQNTESVTDYLIYSGDIIYIDNLENLSSSVGVDFPRQKIENQKVDLKMILTF